MDQKFLEQLAEILPEKNIYINEPMNKHTTFRIGGSADVLVTPGVSETAEVLRLCKNHDIPVTIIGNGSNLLVGDQGIRGVVIEFGRPAEEISVGDILRVLEGGLEAATCPGTEGDGGCQGSDLCVAKLVWKRINDSITDAVDTLMLSELIEESRRIHEK